MNLDAAHRTALGLAALLVLSLPAGAQTTLLCGQWQVQDPPVGATRSVTEVDASGEDEAWALAFTLGLIRWDGAQWSEHPQPDLSGLYGQWSFATLAAGAAGELILAGGGITGPFSSDLVLARWGGAAWDDIATLTLQPNIAGAPRNPGVQAVASTAPDDAWIIGNAPSMGDGQGDLVLTVHWDGEELTEFLTPGVGDRQNNLYDAVAIAPDDVWAVGTYNNTGPPDGYFRGLIYHWDGSGWTPIPNPTEDIPSSHLYAVDGVASDDIWAGGDTIDGPLFMHWDGEDWTIVSSPADMGTIYQIAAIAPDDVWAVDSPWVFPGGSKYYHWDGVSWDVVPAPPVDEADYVSRHGGLAAAGECYLWSVGSKQIGSQLYPHVERLTVDGTQTGAPNAVPGPAAGITSVAPNPFNPRVQVAFRLEQAGHAALTVHDLRGRVVRTLSRGPLAAGGHTASWNGRDESGRALPSGSYLLRLETAAITQSRSVTLLK